MASLAKLADGRHQTPVRHPVFRADLVTRRASVRHHRMYVLTAQHAAMTLRAARHWGLGRERHRMLRHSSLGRGRLGHLRWRSLLLSSGLRGAAHRCHHQKGREHNSNAIVMSTHEAWLKYHHTPVPEPQPRTGRMSVMEPAILSLCGVPHNFRTTGNRRVRQPTKTPHPQSSEWGARSALTAVTQPGAIWSAASSPTRPGPSLPVHDQARPHALRISHTRASRSVLALPRPCRPQGPSGLRCSLRASRFLWTFRLLLLWAPVLPSSRLEGEHQSRIWRVGPANGFAMLPQTASAGATHRGFDGRLCEIEITKEVAVEPGIRCRIRPQAIR